jgi:hypothetical protein
MLGAVASDAWDNCREARHLRARQEVLAPLNDPSSETLLHHPKKKYEKRKENQSI